MDNNLIVERNTIADEPKKSVNLSKFIFGILGLIIIVELVFGVRSLLIPIPVIGQKLPALVPGQIALVSDRSSYKVGDTAMVDIRVSTGGYTTLGTDASIKYDPSFLEASSGAFTQGNLYPDYPIVTIDNQKGSVKVSAVDPQGNGFNGNGILGTVRFTTKKQGKASLTVEYQPNSSVFSNMVDIQSSKDILGAFYGVDLNVSNVSNPTQTQTCQERVYSLCQDSKGVQGTYWCTSIQNPYSCDIGCFMNSTANDRGCRIVTNASKK